MEKDRLTPRISAAVKAKGDALFLIAAVVDSHRSAGFAAMDDDILSDGSLAKAAGCLAIGQIVYDENQKSFVGREVLDASTSHSRLQQLAVAAALIVEEMERLQREKINSIAKPTVQLNQLII